MNPAHGGSPADDPARVTAAEAWAGTTLGSTEDPRLWAILPPHATRGSAGGLQIAGMGMPELADRFGTPLHIYDETGLREQIRAFVNGLQARWPNSEVIYASKAFPALAMYRLAAEEGISVDVAGLGEMILALEAGCDPGTIYFHGNAKSEEELRLAVRHRIGTIIVDNDSEIDLLESVLAESPGVMQKTLLRVTPDVHAVTHAAQATGGADAKFGLPPDQAVHAIRRMRRSAVLDFQGVHVHIGSQILDPHSFAESVRKIADLGEFPVYDVGGGLGIGYVVDQQVPSVDAYLDALVGAAHEVLPPTARLLIEPGRSIVGRSGVTLYRVLSVKRTGKLFVAVDGGIADNADVAMTSDRNTVVFADRLDEPLTAEADIVGRQCESGDLLSLNMPIPADVKRGDLVVMAATGAYAYTFSNNYNGALRPAIVFVANGQARLVARRETAEDLLRLHVGL